MRLTDTDLSVRDREWVERVVQPDEELLLVCKPLARLWRPEYSDGLVFAIFWVSGVGIFTYLLLLYVLPELFESPMLFLVLLFMLPFWLVSLAFITTPWMNRTVAQRTVYLVTSKRAIVLAPTAFFLSPTQKDYPLVPDMIREVKSRPDGSGDVVLNYEEYTTKHGTHWEPVGFMRVPQVAPVVDVLRELMPSSPPPSPVQVQSGEQKPFVLSDEERPVEFPNLLTLLVGCFFMLIGGSQVVSNWQTMCMDGHEAWWGSVLFGLAWPMLFAFVGCRAALQWCREYKEYRRSKR